MAKKLSHCVVKDGEVQATGTKDNCQHYVKRLGGSVRKYCGPIGTKVQEKRAPINSPSAVGGIAKAGVELTEANIRRAKFEHLTSNGVSDPKPTVPKPEDGFFRKPSEGRTKLTQPKKKVPKLKTELWNGHRMVNFLRTEQIDADKTDWFITMNKPSRKLTREDQIVLFLAHSDTEYTVQINTNHKYLIIDELQP